MVGHLVGVGRGFGAGDLFEGGAHAGDHQELAAHAQHVSTGDFHGLLLLPQSVGLCGLWQSLQAMPPECSAVTTCGNVLGLAVSFSWQRTQRVATVGSLGTLRRRVVGVFGERPVAGLAGDVGVLAAGADLAFVFVAHDAGGLPGVGDGMLADGCQRAGAVVAVLAESLGYHRAANHHEDSQSGQQDDCRPDQMP